jgi:molybdenum cofactor synthesis domain-containing protein
MDRPIRVAILTISDRSARGERPDAAGPALIQAIEARGWQVTETAILPDDRPAVERKLAGWCDSACCDLLLTTGGTGFAPRDVTPEATLAVIQRAAPGLAELMRLESLKITPHAALSRAVAGIRARTLIINLPGSPKAAVENLGFLLPILPHAIDLLQDSPSAEAGH